MPKTGKNTRKLILDVATDLFGKHGFDKVTLKQVSAALGISEPAVYRYFESKEALITSVLESLVERLESDELFKLLSETDEVDRILKGLATHIVTYFSDRQGLYRLLLFSSLSGHAGARKAYKTIRGSYCQFLRRQLDRLYRSGKIRSVNNEITARCFTGMVFDCALGNTLWKGMQGRIFDPQKTILNNVGIYARGLQIESSAK
jgi:AcrR family transcriptional regulator